MSLTALLLALLLVVVTLLTAGGVAALLVCRPALATPVAAAITAEMLMATVAGVLVAVTSS
ncbi:hypothetical protein ACFC00_26885 [Streptomyces adustus]|uniref:hypothetical protein n=1 Tax=Streptomyces adustus TaxID=1609272 RepID=UPI0035E0CC3A